jgi:hypothetical protein
VNGNPIRKMDPFGLQAFPQDIQCENCTTDQQNKAREAIRETCKKATAPSGNCRNLLMQNNMFGCMMMNCLQGNWRVVCMKDQCSDSGCGGPCNPASLTYVATGTIFLQPFAFRADTMCNGAVPNTVAHEMAHTCGVGYDADRRDPVHRANKKLADEIGLACGGPM